MKKQSYFAFFMGCFLLVFMYNDAANATVKLPAIFGTNMVLQSKMKVPVWGWANANEKIELVFLGKTFKTKAGDNGKWQLKLSSYSAGGPYQMTVKGNETKLIFTNILIGDVWVASGQSNMEFGIKNERNGATAIANAHDQLLHLFTVPISTSLQPKTDIDSNNTDPMQGKWIICSPENLIYDHKPWTGFSAIGYYFGLQIRDITHGPVGIISTNKGGTPAQAWMSLNGLYTNPEFARYVSKRNTTIENFDAATAAYPRQLATYQAAFDQWNINYGKAYNEALKKWEADNKVQPNAVGPRPMPGQPAPVAPIAPDGGFGGPANLYNAMLNPILHYGIKGVIWYQGENNGDSITDASFYYKLFPELINDWRKQWQEGNFPFLYVQLANFRAAAKSPSEGNWSWVREGQLKALALPNAGMAVITDLGEADNIHPKDKKDVAIRLGLIAKHLVYNEQVTYTGPTYHSMKIEGNKIKLTLDGGPLIVGHEANPDRTKKELNGFGIADADQLFYWAKATIEGNTITVYSDKVEKPVAVRYNWADNPPGNLYNSAGLPASPFRTDDWPPILTVTTK